MNEVSVVEIRDSTWTGVAPVARGYLFCSATPQNDRSDMTEAMTAYPCTNNLEPLT